MAHLPVQTKPAVLALLLAGVLAACGRPEPAAPVANPTPTEQEIAGARDAASQLGSRLKARLMAAMSEGGPIAAIEVCAEEAPQIAQQVSEETGYRVGRTSLRVRNPANARSKAQKKAMDLGFSAVTVAAWPKIRPAGRSGGVPIPSPPSGLLRKSLTPSQTR